MSGSKQVRTFRFIDGDMLVYADPEDLQHLADRHANGSIDELVGFIARSVRAELADQNPTIH